MHPLVRDLYKRALVVGIDYPHPEGLHYIRRVWKMALRNPDNCPSCYVVATNNQQCEHEIRKAVGKGRAMIREMIGVIQLKKYRTMKKRYYSADDDAVIRTAALRSKEKIREVVQSIENGRSRTEEK